MYTKDSAVKRSPQVTLFKKPEALVRDRLKLLNADRAVVLYFCVAHILLLPWEALVIPAWFVSDQLVRSDQVNEAALEGCDTWRCDTRMSTVRPCACRSS